MHVATGALAGAVTGDRAAAAVAGLALHAAGDSIPHEDFESLRKMSRAGCTVAGGLAASPKVTEQLIKGGPDPLRLVVGG